MVSLIHTMNTFYVSFKIQEGSGMQIPVVEFVAMINLSNDTWKDDHSVRR